MYVEDYILRLIYEMVRALFKMLFGKDIEEDIFLSYKYEDVYNKLIHWIDNGEINLAENDLVENLKLNDKQYF